VDDVDVEFTVLELARAELSELSVATDLQRITRLKRALGSGSDAALLLVVFTKREAVWHAVRSDMLVLVLPCLYNLS